ncbi:MAG: carboxypeptidase-like regulatory domain-containing protein [Terriglobales bacterium]
MIVAILAGLLVFLPETSRAEVICGKVPPLKPVHCVCGKLIDQNGNPVSGALLRLNRDGVEAATGSTDADGNFLFHEMKSGKYELAADFDDFQPFRSSIVLTKPAKKCRRELVIVMMLHYPDNCGSYVMRR